jgi:hypothetical protein
MRSGKKVLTGKFKKLFLEGVREIVEYCIEDGFQDVSDVASNGAEHHAVFGRLEPEEMVFAIAEVTRALTTKVAPPDLCQWRESAVYAVFEAISAAVQIEIDMHRTCEDFASSPREVLYFWRSLVSSAERQVREEDEDCPYIDIDCDDEEEWDYLVSECLADHILWDRDFITEYFSDFPPGASKELNKQYGISDDYYTEVIPLVTSKMLADSGSFICKALKVG